MECTDQANGGRSPIREQEVTVRMGPVSLSLARVFTVLSHVAHIEGVFPPLRDAVRKDPINVVWAIKVELLATILNGPSDFREICGVPVVYLGIDSFGEMVIKITKRPGFIGGPVPGAAHGIQKNQPFRGLLLGKIADDPRSAMVIVFGELVGR